jgi:CheY-like chemotaxis protein
MQKILYVDDDPDDHEIFLEVLKSVNPSVKCTIAVDGIDALEKLNSTDSLPDYIFLDFNMPRMNGLQMLRELRKYDRFRNLKVVMYSTTRMDHEAEECKRLGAIDFIVKAPSISELKQNLIKLISTYKSGGMVSK